MIRKIIFKINTFNKILPVRDYRQATERQISFLRNYSQKLRNGNLARQTVCNGKATIFDIVLAFKWADFVTVDFHMEAVGDLSFNGKRDVEDYMVRHWIPNYVGRNIPCRVYWVRVNNGVKKFEF
jgi:hypothetical protein